MENIHWFSVLRCAVFFLVFVLVIYNLVCSGILTKQNIIFSQIYYVNCGTLQSGTRAGKLTSAKKKLSNKFHSSNQSLVRGLVHTNLDLEFSLWSQLCYKHKSSAAAC